MLKLVKNVIVTVLLLLMTTNVYAQEPIDELTDIKFFYEDKTLNVKAYHVKQRYYLPLNDIVQNLQGYMTKNNRNIGVMIGKDDIFLQTGNTLALKNGNYIKLATPIKVINNQVYTDLTNLNRIFNLKAVFDYEAKQIKLFKSDAVVAKTSSNNSNNKALLRFEDFVFSGKEENGNSNKLSKYRIMSDELYKNNVPYHIAWIPRFIDPAKNIDNDLLRNYNIANVDYVYTLDYMNFRGGIIGLHGYTHQWGEEKSASGADFSSTVNNTWQSATNQILKAKNTADYLMIPYEFFEFPHYAATQLQLQVAEENFKYIYQPYNSSKSDYYNIKTLNNGTKYIPTPLDCLNGASDIDSFLAKADNTIANKQLGSFFFHPDIELHSIQLEKDYRGNVKYKYNQNSPLLKIVDKFVANGYNFKTIKD